MPPPPPAQGDTPASRKPPSKAKQETVGVVLTEQHKAGVALLHDLSKLSRSEIIRQLLDQGLGFASRDATVLDIVITRAELQYQLREELQAYSKEGNLGDLPAGTFVRRVESIAHAGPITLHSGRLGFEGYLGFTADVEIDGAKRNKSFVHLFMAEVHPGPRVMLTDLGPEAEEIGPVEFIKF